MRDGIKSVIFDIDGTLSPLDSWEYLTSEIGGSVAKNNAIFSARAKGELTETEFYQHLLANWTTSEVPSRKTFRDILGTIHLHDDAEEVIAYLKTRGYKLCLMTGSFDVCGELMAEKLDIPTWYANTKLSWGPDDTLVGIETTLLGEGKLKKASHLLHYCETNGFQAKECIAVGDSPNDIELFKITGRGIALRTKFTTGELEATAWKIIGQLSELKELL